MQVNSLNETIDIKENFDIFQEHVLHLNQVQSQLEVDKSENKHNFFLLWENIKKFGVARYPKAKIGPG